jgi:hypothetical protein
VPQIGQELAGLGLLADQARLGAPAYGRGQGRRIEMRAAANRLLGTVRNDAAARTGPTLGSNLIKSKGRLSPGRPVACGKIA